MTESNAQSPWLTLAEAVEELHAHESTVRRWADRGAIKTVRTPGGQRRFAREDVERIATEGYTAEVGSASAHLLARAALLLVATLLAVLVGWNAPAGTPLALLLAGGAWYVLVRLLGAGALAVGRHDARNDARMVAR